MLNFPYIYYAYLRGASIPLHAQKQGGSTRALWHTDQGDSADLPGGHRHREALETGGKLPAQKRALSARRRSRVLRSAMVRLDHSSRRAGLSRGLADHAQRRTSRTSYALPDRDIPVGEPLPPRAGRILRRGSTAAWRSLSQRQMRGLSVGAAKVFSRAD